jgi:S-methylmethionine-dependent homocysteine/selenocysteine methylase
MAGPLQRLLENQPFLVLDGAMGTELHRRGVDISLPLWSARALLKEPNTVLQIHKDYLAAGADIITTNTFRTTRRTFRRSTMIDRSLELTGLAVRLARKSLSAFPQRRVLVAGSMAPLEDCYRPDLVPLDHELREEHAAHAYQLAAAGVDFLLVETIGTVREAFAACEAAVRTGLETVVSFLCTKDGNLYGGEPLEDAVSTIELIRPFGFSLNCVSPRHLSGLLKTLRSLTDRPLAVYGNVGLPDGERSEELICDVTPDEYASLAVQWNRLGASIIGGCCGTTPEFIRKVRSALELANSEA